jgi:DMSO/TMAO reductase YedYZ heme-binding membrane subunit
MKMTLLQVFVPFTSTYQPLGIAFGVLAMYGLVAILVSSKLWVDSKPALWKRIHYLSYAVLALVFMHGLIVGTDLHQGVARLVWGGFGLLLLLGVVIRLARLGALSEGKKR